MAQTESFNTPTKAGGRIVDRDAESVRAHARINSNAVRDEAFFDKYLQPLGDDTLPTTKVWEKLKQKVIRDFKGRNESAIYVLLASLLNEMSCIVHRKVYARPRRQKSKGKATIQKNAETCILFRDTNNLAPRGVENMRIRPDLTATKADYQTTRKCVNSPSYGIIKILYWYKIITFVEAKVDDASEGDNNQSRGYASRMPEARPDLAGVLYLVVSKEKCRICWSDASRAVQGPSFPWFVEGRDEFDDVALQYLFRFVKTLYTPLPEFTQIDPTVKFVDCDNDENPSWAFKLKGKAEEFVGTRLSSSPAYGRQTFVLRARKGDDETSSNTGTDTRVDSGTEPPDTPSHVTTPAAGSGPEHEDETEYKYVIKDHWRDGSRRFREADLYAKANGVRGMAQMYHGEKVTDDNGEQIRTSEYHSGENSTLEGDAPQRFKERVVLSSTGEPLEKRKTLLEFLEAMYDVVQTHQTLVNKKGILHRDLSPNNILLNMRHNEDCEFDDYPDEKYIHEVLNGPPKEGEKKEVKGGTIDLDNGEDLNKTEGCNKTERTGTRTYVAIPVAEGKCDVRIIRPRTIRYPELSGAALRLYIEAYGEDAYRYYIEEFYKSPSELVDHSIPFRQLPVHDAESIIWIIIDYLLKAIPGGGDPEVTESASTALKILANHILEPSADSRRCFRDFSREWLHNLHPKLTHLAPMLCKFSELLSINWTFLCIKGLLPQDILHEAVKRILLEEIVRIRAEQCDVSLKEEIRRPLVPAPKTINASPSTASKRKSTSAVASTSKRVRHD